MRRREFIALVSGAATLPLAARAQQASPAVIGYFSAAATHQANAFVRECANASCKPLSFFLTLAARAKRMINEWVSVHVAGTCRCAGLQCDLSRKRRGFAERRL
jgi:hypothetical protein